MQAGDKIISNNGEADFLGEVSFIEENIVYFEVDDDQYWAPLASCSLMGHMDNRDWWRATTYEG